MPWQNRKSKNKSQSPSQRGGWLDRLTAEEIKKLSAEELLSAYGEAQKEAKKAYDVVIKIQDTDPALIEAKKAGRTLGDNSGEAKKNTMPL
jgi:hypothetical protein